MNVAQCMTPEPATVGPERTLFEALVLMDDLGVRHLPVVSDGRLVGIVSDRDLLEHTGYGFVGGDVGIEDRGRDTTVDSLMRRDPVTAAPDDPIVSAVTELSVRGIGCLPVVERGRLVGIVTETDFLRLMALLGSTGLAPGALDPVVRELARFDLATIEASETLSAAAAVMRRRACRHVPVLGANGVVSAMLSDRDLRRAIGAGVAWSHPVGSVAMTDATAVDAAARVSVAAALMSARKVGALLVTGAEQPGIVTTTDLLEHALGALS